MLTLDEFAGHVGDQLDRQIAAADPDLDLAADLGLDSLELVWLLLLIEELAAVTDAPADLPVFGTLGEAYAYYRSLAGP